MWDESMALQSYLKFCPNISFGSMFGPKYISDYISLCYHRFVSWSCMLNKSPADSLVSLYVAYIQELKTETTEQPDPSRIEVVSVTEEDLPSFETPNTLNFSPLGSFVAEPQSENDSAKPEEPQPLAATSPTMPITKVQPFIHGETLSCSWYNGTDWNNR